MTTSEEPSTRPSWVGRFLKRNAGAIITALATLAAAFITAFGISEHRRDTSESELKEMRAELGERSRQYRAQAVQLETVIAERDRWKGVASARPPTSTDASPAINLPPGQKTLDGTVKIISTCQMWDYQPSAISIDGVMYDDYGVLAGQGCNSADGVTFDIRGYDRFEGFAGIAETSSDSNNFTIKVDGTVVAAHQLKSSRPATKLSIELGDHKTLTFQRDDSYPRIIIGQPVLTATPR
jgi:hypothetical protein